MAEAAAPQAMDGYRLQVALRLRQGSHALAIEFTTRAAWTLLFGPSGSGKSSVLRAIAGFLTPDFGAITVGDPARVLYDNARRIHLAPHIRPVRSAPQAPRLIPHRRVLANLQYGLGVGLPATQQRETVDCIIDLFELRPLLERSPHQLSGGELQRVSVARAVLSTATAAGPQPPLLLLDEPFSGLDGALRDTLATQLQMWLAARRIPVLSVSHDVAEAFLLRAEVLRLADGRIVEQGSADAVLAAERHRLLGHLQP